MALNFEIPFVQGGSIFGVGCFQCYLLFSWHIILFPKNICIYRQLSHGQARKNFMILEIKRVTTSSAYLGKITILSFVDMNRQ